MDGLFSGNGTDRGLRGASPESVSQVEDRRAAILYPKVLAGGCRVTANSRESAGDVGGHRHRKVGRVPPGGGLADGGKHGGAGARGAAQVNGVESGNGGLDARR